MFKQFCLKKSGNRIVFSFLLAAIFIYILLFEFILPVNKVLPKPSILYLSLSSLFTDYNFLSAFLFTVSVIYVSIFFSYLLLKFFSPLLINLSFSFPQLDKVFAVTKYIRPVILIMLFTFWFGSNSYAEYLFALVITATMLKEAAVSEAKKVKRQYVDAASSLGLSEKEMSKKIIWKSIQPLVYKALVKSNFLLWSLVLVYEFIARTNGLGNILRKALKYNDISVFVLIAIIVTATIYLFSFLFESIKKKFFFWET